MSELTVVNWLDEEVCCGFIWSQFEAFSMYVSYCPNCGSALGDEVPWEARQA